MTTRCGRREKGEVVHRQVASSVGLGLLLLCVLTGPSRADNKSDDSYKTSDAEQKITKAGCKKISAPTILNGSDVSIAILPAGVLSAVSKIPGIDPDDVHQIRVRLKDGKQYFLVLPDSDTYECSPGATLPLTAMRHPVEPVTDISLRFNPCCTYTYGGDAQAQWFNLVNCPLSKPKKLQNSVCGQP